MELTQNSPYRHYYIADRHDRRLQTARLYRLRREMRKGRITV